MNARIRAYRVTDRNGNRLNPGDTIYGDNLSMAAIYAGVDRSGRYHTDISVRFPGGAPETFYAGTFGVTVEAACATITTIAGRLSTSELDAVVEDRSRIISHDAAVTIAVLFQPVQD